MNDRSPRIAQVSRAILVGVALTLLTVGPAGAQSFFSYPPPPPVAAPSSDVVVHTSVVRVNSPLMYLDGGGNPRQHSWFVKADSTSLTITLQAGIDGTGCCLFGSGAVITATVFNGPTLLATFTTTEPMSSPPAATNSATITTVPGTTYRINVSTPAPVQPAPFAVYRLKVDGAQELEPLGAPASVSSFASTEAGTRWVMNVAAGEPLNFAVVGGAPCFPMPAPGAACPVLYTEVSVFDPNHQLQPQLFMTPVAQSGSNFSIPTAGNTPGAWMIVIDQQPPPMTLASAYRLQKGTFVNPSISSPALVGGSAGVDPAVYAAWFTDGKGLAQINISAPSAVTSVGATLSRDLFTGHGGFGVTGTQTGTFPTNQNITLGGSAGPDVGQYHLTITVPTGYVAEPDHLDMPVTIDALTTVVVHIKDVTAPELTLPADTIAEATSASGASVSYSASATDFIDGPVSVNCLPASGSTFVLGPTTVNCSASDSSGNTATGGFTVTVRDTTRPILTCPPNVTVFQDSAYGARVTFAPTVTDAVGAASTSTPASGSVFPLGTTTVNCTAADTSGNQATPCSFTVTVVTPVSTVGVKSTDGGSIDLPGGIGTFGIVAMSSNNSVVKGSVEYQDHVTGMNLKSTAITAIVVSGTHARIFGKATINGAGSNDFVVDVDDMGEPGIGIDTFGIQISTGYVAGPSVLRGGNIQVHR